MTRPGRVQGPTSLSLSTALQRPHGRQASRQAAAASSVRGRNILIEQLDQRLGLDNRLAAGAHSSRGSSCPRRPGGRRLSRT